MCACVRVGAAPGGDSSEAEPELSYPSAGGGQEYPAGAAGGGRGGPQEPGETTGHAAGSGMDPTVILNVSLPIGQGFPAVNTHHLLQVVVARFLTHEIGIGYKLNPVLGRSKLHAVLLVI